MQLQDLNKTDIELADRWILSRLNQCIKTMNEAMQGFRLSDAIHALYSFTWTEYCDWYIELCKMRLYNEEDPQGQKVARSMLVYVLNNILRLMHPLMPFITEEIWQSLPDDFHEKTDVKTIMLQPFPVYDEKKIDITAEKDMQLLQNIIGAVRNIRA